MWFTVSNYIFSPQTTQYSGLLSLFFKNNFIFFLATLVCIAAQAFSLVVANRDYSLAAVRGLLILVAYFVAEHGLWGSVAAAPRLCSTGQWLWLMGLVVLWHVESSQIRD